MIEHTRRSIIKGVEVELEKARYNRDQALIELENFNSYIKVLEWSFDSLNKHYADD